MAPLNPISSWVERGVGGSRAPRARWFFICEGSKTERIYFESLFSILDKRGFRLMRKLGMLNALKMMRQHRIQKDCSVMLVR